MTKKKVIEPKKEQKELYKIELGKIVLKNYSEKTDPTKNWIQWGEKNDMPDTLLSLLYNSSTHFNIVNKRKNMVLGDGIYIDKTTVKNQIATEAFLKKVNRYGESMEQILEKIVYDYIVFRSCALQVIWGKGGNKIAELFHMPMANIRFGKKDKFGNIDKYYYSENFLKYTMPDYKPVPIISFSTVPEIIAVEPTQLLVMRSYSPGCGYYSQPSYVGGLNDISLDWQMSEFSQSMIKNGCFPGLIVIQKNVADGEKDFIVKEFERQYTSSSNTKKVIYNFVENLDDIKFDTLDVAGQETMIKVLKELATNNILQAHGISGILVGIAQSGSLSDASQINNAYLEYENSVIKPDQKVIINYINGLLEIMGLDKISITSSAPIPFQISEDAMQNVLTMTEMREMLGFPELKSGEESQIVSNMIQAKATAPVVATKQEKPKNYGRNK